jgi:hypothetical protein
MRSVCYFATWTDSGCVLGCEHQHQTVTAAAACISSAGGYVVAVENGVLRALTDEEEVEFQTAMYGGAEGAQDDCDFLLALILVVVLR